MIWISRQGNFMWIGLLYHHRQGYESNLWMLGFEYYLLLGSHHSFIGLIKKVLAQSLVKVILRKQVRRIKIDRHLKKEFLRTLHPLK